MIVKQWSRGHNARSSVHPQCVSDCSTLRSAVAWQECFPTNLAKSGWILGTTCLLRPRWEIKVQRVYLLVLLWLLQSLKKPDKQVMIISWVKWDETSRFLSFNLRCCHGQLAPIFSGHLLAFDVIGNKVWEIASVHIVTIGNEESCPWQHRNFTGASPKLRHQSYVAPYSTDDRSISY